MPTVKKRLLVFVVILAIASVALLAARCGDTDPAHPQGGTDEEYQNRAVDGTSETAPATKEIAAESKVNGVIYETELFSILVPDGWVTEGLSAEDLAAEGSVGVVIMKDKDVMQLSVLVDIPDAATFSKQQVELVVKGLNGTALEEVTILGIKFFKTSCTLDGRDQTVFYGDRNGDVVMISMSGKDYQNNVEIKAMLDSIKFK
jgi:hypothetical protein